MSSLFPTISLKSLKFPRREIFPGSEDSCILSGLGKTGVSGKSGKSGVMLFLRIDKYRSDSVMNIVTFNSFSGDLSFSG